MIEGLINLLIAGFIGLFFYNYLVYADTEEMQRSEMLEHLGEINSGIQELIENWEEGLIITIE